MAEQEGESIGTETDQLSEALNQTLRLEAEQKDKKKERITKTIATLMTEITTNDAEKQLAIVSKLRKLLCSEVDPPIDEVVQAGVVPILINFLKCHNNPALQFETAWALTNIVSGTSEHVTIVLENGIGPLLLELLYSPNVDIKEQVLWVLGNIAGDSATSRDYLLKIGVFPVVLQLISTASKLTMLRTVVWALSNLCRGKPRAPLNIISTAIPVLAQIIRTPGVDKEVLVDALWAISHISEGGETRIQAVLDSGVARQLVDTLLCNNPVSQTPALRTLGNIATGDDAQTQALLDLNVLPALEMLLESKTASIRKEVCWTFSNLVACGPSQIQAVLAQPDLISKLLSLLGNVDVDTELKKELVWVFSNATSGGTAEQCQYLFLVDCGLIPEISKLLDHPMEKIVLVALETLINVLKVSVKEGERLYADMIAHETRNYIKELQNSESDEIYQKAYQLSTMLPVITATTHY